MAPSERIEGINKERFSCISPLDHRYWKANEKLFLDLSDFLSEEAVVNYSVKVEIALLTELIREMPEIELTEDIESIIDKASKQVTADSVEREELKTEHNVRALVNVLQRELPKEFRHLVHVGATSFDITDTASALRYRDAILRVVVPLLISVEELLINLVENEATTPQVGRTHGQYAVPVTFGFAMAEYVSRLGKAIIRLVQKVKDLRGKLSGAVGAYNATSIIVDDPQSLETTVLANLDLKPSETSSQIVEPEYLLQVFLELNTIFGIIANLCDDLRHLQRSEINEVREGFGAQQVGSSTMPQKRNPWNSEHVKSLWKAFSPRIMTLFMDQISEHQRDLTNSASARFLPEFIAGLVAAANRTHKILSGLQVDRNRMLERLRESGADLVMAEAVYIMLAISGETDAHEKIRKFTIRCERENCNLFEVIRTDDAIWGKLELIVQKRFKISAVEFFSSPDNYTGFATAKALSIAAKYREQMSSLKKCIDKREENSGSI